MFSRTKFRDSTYAILSNIKAFHARMQKISDEQFWKEIDRAILSSNFANKCDSK